MPVEYLLLPELDVTYVKYYGHVNARQNRDNRASTYTAIFAPRPELSSLAYAYAKMSEGTDCLDAKVYEEPGSALMSLGLTISPSEFFDAVEDDQS